MFAIALDFAVLGNGINIDELFCDRLARLHQRTLRIYQENERMHRDDEGP